MLQKNQYLHPQINYGNANDKYVQSSGSFVYEFEHFEFVQFRIEKSLEESM